MMKGRLHPTMHKVLRQLPYALYAVGVRGKDEEMNAFLGSWVTQCSFDPPMVMVAINRTTISCELVKKGKVFSVNLLDKTDKKLARLLVKPAHRVGDKLGKISHVEEDTGAPVLREAFAYFECKVKSIYTPGDHALVVGEVVNAGIRGRGEPLTCADLRWHYAG